MKYLPLMLMVVCHPLWAKDILWMNNGDRLTGTIEEIGDESVRIALPYTGAVTVKRDAIKRWRLEKQDKPKATAKGGSPCSRMSRMSATPGSGAEVAISTSSSSTRINEPTTSTSRE